jgi:hypothetical protein
MCCGRNGIGGDSLEVEGTATGCILMTEDDGNGMAFETNRGETGETAFGDCGYRLTTFVDSGICE